MEKFKKVECCNQGPRLKEIKYGVMVEYQGHFYIKVNKRKPGENISLSIPGGHSLLLNPVYGTVRAVNADTRVDIIEYCENPPEVYTVPENKLSKYLR